MTGVAASVSMRLANYRDAEDAAALVALLDEYARDPMGGGQPLPDRVRRDLPACLAACPQAFTLLAFQAGRPVGLVNAFETISTFRARPLINLHDVAVTAEARGQGIGRAMLEWIEAEARRRGCCKLTLEVLEGNGVARALY